MDVVPRIGHFFVRCPDPLAYPEGVAEVVSQPYELVGFERVAAHLLLDGTAFGAVESPSNMFVSVRFHRGKRPSSLIETSLHEMKSVLVESLPNEACGPAINKDADRENLDRWATFTVAELATPIAAPNESGVYCPVPVTRQYIVDAFERSVEALFLIIRGYRNSEKLSLRTPTRERLGSEFFVITRKAVPGEGSWDEEGGWMVNTLAIPPGQPDDLTKEGVGRLRASVAAELAGHPMVAVGELQSDADWALSQGDYRAAVMLYHTASEVSLDIALMLMQWEEGLSVQDAALVFQQSLMERVRNQYHGRIGGNWNTKNGTVCDIWRRDLVLLRHRVAHGGIDVRPPETHLASDAYRKMRNHLFGRLAVSVKKYPITAGIFVSQEGLLRRGPLTKAVRAALATPTGECISEFNSWRSSVIQSRFS